MEDSVGWKGWLLMIAELKMVWMGNSWGSLRAHLIVTIQSGIFKMAKDKWISKGASVDSKIIHLTRVEILLS
jgi:formate/nitrite transporter FocA (FNT family)